MRVINIIGLFAQFYYLLYSFKMVFLNDPSRRCNLQATKAVEALIKARVNPNYISRKMATPPIIIAVEKVVNLKVKP